MNAAERVVFDSLVAYIAERRTVLEANFVVADASDDVAMAHRMSGARDELVNLIDHWLEPLALEGGAA
jgi:hypothetical protein